MTDYFAEREMAIGCHSQLLYRGFEPIAKRSPATEMRL